MPELEHGSEEDDDDDSSSGSEDEPEPEQRNPEMLKKGVRLFAAHDSRTACTRVRLSAWLWGTTGGICGVMSWKLLCTELLR
jgi:hypothetical protein